MSKKNTIVAVGCIMALLAGSFFTGADSKALTVKKTTSTVSIKEGESKVIKLSGAALKKVKNPKRNISIKSSNKKIAKVSQKKSQKKKYSFTITGKKKGKTTVTVKYKKKSIKITVKVMKANKKKPENVTVTQTPAVTPTQVVQTTPAPTQGNVVVPTQRPVRTRITVPESKPETQGEYTKVTNLSTYSIDGNNVVNIWKDPDNKYYYNVVCDGNEIIEISELGIELSDTDLTSNLICNDKESYVDEIYEEFETITLADATSLNNCQERTIRFSNEEGAHFDLLVRVYNDGYAYKYSDVTYGTEDKLVCTEENSTIIFPEDTSTWGGLAWINTCENGFDKKEYSAFVRSSAQYHPPLLANVGDYWVLTSEAQRFNNNGEFCSSRLVKSANSNVLRWDFGDARDETIPLEEQAKADDTNLDLVNVDQKDITEVETVNGFSTPWRAMVISNDFDEFCTSSLITNLNPAPEESKYAELYEDISWIKPGKVLWSWWSDGNNQGRYQTHIDYIDYASEYGMDYICLDVGWRTFEDRLEELCDYAEERGVKVFCWVNYWELTTAEDVEALFSKWAEAGAVGVKTDYFEGEEQQVLNSMENVAVIGAKYHFMVLYHGCVSPAGESRTYPNILTTEAVLGEENRIWSTSPSSYNCLMYPFTRNILGSMDYTPACMTIANMNDETEGFALAKSVVYESGLLHLAAPAKDYGDYIGTEFIQSLYTTWDESFVPTGEASPGEYITYVRRHGNEWFIGSMTMEDRTVSVDLSFLDANKNYTAYIYYAQEDGLLDVTTENLTSADKFERNLSKLDGVAVRIVEE